MLIPRHKWILFWLAAIFFQVILPAEKLCAQSKRNYRLPPGKSSSDIHPTEFYIKFKASEGFATAKTLGPAPDLTLSSLGDKIPVKQTVALDPASHASTARTMQTPSQYLQNLYRVSLSEGNVLEVINQLLRYDNVNYAVPVFKEELFLVPNDPDAATNSSKQAYLASIKAYDAWDITQGDSTVIIGIVDTGVEYTHEDLSQNLSLNTADPIDGLDNDGNGLVDDYRGWDFADNDNNPLADGSGHGTHVAGLSSARTNNGTGMAGTGFHSKYLPLKGFRTSNNASFGTYEAIIYAANQGIDVLNLSWGSVDSFNPAAQDIINYAVLEKNVVVVAAAGNTNAELTFYPASYDHVLSVGASANDGTKASFATYGYYVDLLAPGASVHSTTNGNAYGVNNGSSFAAPLAAGAAALLRAHFPAYSAVQLMEQLRVTADPVDALTGNASYQGQLGHGLLNMHRALTDTLSPAVRLTDDSLYSQAGQLAYFGDTVHIDLAATNWLRPASGLQISLQALSEYGVMLPNSWTIPVLSAFDTSTHSISIVLKANTPPLTRVVVKAGMEATDYSDFQYFEFVTAPDTASLISAGLMLTLSAAGELGYTADTLKGGNGFRYKNEILLQQAGFLVGTGKDNLADNVVNNLMHSTRNDGFEVSGHLKPYSYAAADHYYENSFTAAISETQEVLVDQKTMAWASPADSNFLITEYRVTNTAEEILPDFHAGLFTNWNLANRSENHTVWVDSLQLGLSYNHDGDYFSGIALLTGQTATFFAADLDNLSGNTADVEEILTDSAKFAWLSSDFIKSNAGSSGNGNNTAQMNGVDLGNFPAYASEKIAFAWVGGNSEQDIIEAVQQARIRYEEQKNKPRAMATFYACKDETATLSLADGDSWDFFSDAAGQTGLLFQGNNFETGVISGPTKVYVRNTDHAWKGELFAVDILLDPVTADFEISEDPVLLENGSSGGIVFKSTGENNAAWAWEFGNGFQSTRKEPQTTFQSAGTYTVSLMATSPAGCTSSFERPLTVANRAPLPQLETQYICRNASATLQPLNTNTIRVYADEAGETKLFEGQVFHTGTLSEDTVFYVANADSLYESRLLPVAVLMNNPVASFDYLPDTTTLQPAILLANTSTNATSWQWFAGGTLISEEKNASLLPGDAGEMEVRLVATNEQGCTEEVSMTLTFKKSATPVVSNGTVCPGDPFTLAPQNGTYFQFAMSESGNPVYKGKRYRLEDVTDTVHLFVRGIDDIYESDPVEVLVYPYDFAASFQVLPEKLVLEDQKTVRFLDQSKGASSWQWKINGQLMDISQNPVLAFDSAGVYDITLVIRNSNGCIDSTNIDYRVLDVAGLPDRPNYPFSIFPNPAENVIFLKPHVSLQGSFRLEIFDMAGLSVGSYFYKEYTPGTIIEVNTGELKSGVYAVRLISNGKTLQQRFVRQ